MEIQVVTAKNITSNKVLKPMMFASSITHGSPKSTYLSIFKRQNARVLSGAQDITVPPHRKICFLSKALQAICFWVWSHKNKINFM